MRHQTKPLGCDHKEFIMGIMAKKPHNYSASEVEPDTGFPSFFDPDGTEDPVSRLVPDFN
jgi:hypothetical protein